MLSRPSSICTVSSRPPYITPLSRPPSNNAYMTIHLLHLSAGHPSLTSLRRPSLSYNIRLGTIITSQQSVHLQFTMSNRPATSSNTKKFGNQTDRQSFTKPIRLSILDKTSPFFTLQSKADHPSLTEGRWPSSFYLPNQPSSRHTVEIDHKNLAGHPHSPDVRSPLTSPPWGFHLVILTVHGLYSTIRVRPTVHPTTCGPCVTTLHHITPYST